MSRPKHLTTAAAAAAALALGACGGDITVAEDDPNREGAQLFYERCSGCHTLEAANSYGSKPKDDIAGGERTNGPNFDQRKESSVNEVLFAIRNGGYSGAIMPANIVVGDEAEKVARFLVEYSGSQQQRSAAGEGAGP